MKGVLFSIFDPALPASSKLYTELKAMTRKRTSRSIVFVDNLLPELPHPLEVGEDREALLRGLWRQLAVFAERYVRPSLDRGLCVVTDGFGLNAFMAAAAMAEAEVCVRLEKLHHALERQVFDSKRICMPTYFVEHCTPEQEAKHAAMVRPALSRRMNDLKQCSERMHALRREYFSPRFDQLPPHRLPLAERSEYELSQICCRYLGFQVPLAA